MNTTARQVEQLLRAAAEAAAARAPLPPVLRLRCGALGATVAERLEAGADVRQALAGALPAATLDLLAGPRPGLAQAALLVAEDLRLQRERGQLWRDVLVRPAISLGVVLAYALLVAWQRGAGLGAAGLAWGWLAVALGATAVLIATVWIAGRPAAHRHLPWLGSLAHHARQAERYERAGLCADWRLPEAGLIPWLGADLSGLGSVLARADAAGHCRRLADWHRAAARRAQQVLGQILAFQMALIAGALLLAAAAPAWQGVLATVAE
jgi:hypothetical protein